MTNERVAIALGVALAFGPACRSARAREDEGRRLFHGEIALTGTLGGHAEPLPQDAVRCANCHEAAPGPREGAGDAGTLGPALDRASLTRPAPRRGGPPSAYDEAAFCRVLADGIDPAHVMLPRSMPRYTMTKDECEALWTFLTAR